MRQAQAGIKVDGNIGYNERKRTWLCLDFFLPFVYVMLGEHLHTVQTYTHMCLCVCTHMKRDFAQVGAEQKKKLFCFVHLKCNK